MWASSCWKRRTLVRPVRVPDSSFLWRTPKSASLSGSSLHERGLWLNMRLKDNQRNQVTRRKHTPFDLQHLESISNFYTLRASKLTSAQGSSWVSVQRHPLPQGRRTCFHCSAANDQIFPTVYCYRCWGRLLPESLFSSTLPWKTIKPKYITKSNSQLAQVPSGLTTQDSAIEAHRVLCIYTYSLSTIGFHAIVVNVKH